FYNSLQARVERGAISGSADYQVTDRITAYGEASFAKVKGYGLLSPAFSTATGALPLPISIRGDNAFLNGGGATAAALRAEFLAAGRALTTTTVVPVARSYVEFGGRNVATDRETVRLVGGLKGEFDAASRTVSWDAYAQYGEMTGETVTTGVPNVLRLQQATDAVVLGGQTVCRDVNARAQGCVPFDLVNGPSQEAVAWSNGVSTTDQTIKQTVVAASFNTDLFQLPAGPLGLAGGVEYRKEESAFVQDALSAAGALFQNAIGTRSGEFDVKEAYGELRIPLLRDLPFVHDLSVEAAGRLADYSTIGGTEQYRLAAEWAPVRDIRFRVSKNTAVRAPNIPELFAPQSTSFTIAAVDPCDRAVFAAATAAQQAARRVTCAAAIAGYNPATFASNFGAGRNLRVLNGGNPNLGPETARTFQAGVAIQPRWVPTLKVSVDYFRYNIADAVTAIPVNVILQNLCYDDATTPFASNPFCALITRDATGVNSGGVAGGVSQIDITQQNVSKVKVEGYDASLEYALDTAELMGRDYGRFSLRVDATYTYRFALQSLPFLPYAAVLNTISNATPPEWKATGNLEWTKGPVTLGWTTRYVGSMIASGAFAPSQLDPYFTGDHYEHDLRVGYRLNDQVALRGGIINIADATPPLLPETFTGTGLGSGIYDNRGRYFYLGAKLNY
ncbi:MAG: hypothetical protein JWO33_84, partial [Caulobacteraceae bacterium]|nr:hypothetical protein [Caulobacteraceae bacterium]